MSIIFSQVLNPTINPSFFFVSNSKTFNSLYFKNLDLSHYFSLFFNIIGSETTCYFASKKKLLVIYFTNVVCYDVVQSQNEAAFRVHILRWHQIVKRLDYLPLVLGSMEVNYLYNFGLFVKMNREFGTRLLMHLSWYRLNVFGIGNEFEQKELWIILWWQLGYSWKNDG